MGSLFAFTATKDLGSSRAENLPVQPPRNKLQKLKRSDYEAGVGLPDLGFQQEQPCRCPAMYNADET